MGACSVCAFWPVRLFVSDDAHDCDTCADVPMTPEEEERTRPERERLVPSMTRIAEAVTQMQARKGPYYDLAKERSRIVAAAYKAAGSPRKVGATWVGNPIRTVPVFVVRNGGSYRLEPATQADKDAWHAWVRERDRLRRQLGVKRGQGHPTIAADPTTEDGRA
jgi:hypothetical protein